MALKGTQARSAMVHETLHESDGVTHTPYRHAAHREQISLKKKMK